MPKIPEKFEDWTPPWGDGEFDEDKAKRLVFNALLGQQKAKEDASQLRTEKTAVAEELAEVKDKLGNGSQADATAQAAELVELKAKVRKLENDGRPEDKAKIERLTVAIDHGLTARDAERLVGETPEELADDAADLAERLGITKQDDGGQGNPPPSNRPQSTGDLRDGHERPGDPPPMLTAAELVKQGTVVTGGLASLTR